MTIRSAMLSISKSLDTGMWRVSKVSSGEPGEAPDNEVNAHPGNPGDPNSTTLATSLAL